MNIRTFSISISAVTLTALLLTTFANSPKQAQAVAIPKKPQAIVAVALGGGAAKGFAHIGVLQVLEENHIPVKLVTGTSAGAVVGSMYASGMGLTRLEQEAALLERADLMDFTLSTNGFIKGKKLQDYINRQVNQQKIEQFPIPFAAVATDFDTGKAVFFNRGNAGVAVRASSAIPNIFQPVKMGEYLYVDGGLSQPIPVSAALSLNANFVIAVDISAKPQKISEEGFWAYVDQSLNIMNVAAIENELAKATIVIKPKVETLGAVGGFKQKQQAIELGRQATLAVLPEIKKKLSAYQY